MMMRRYLMRRLRLSLWIAATLYCLTVWVIMVTLVLQ